MGAASRTARAYSFYIFLILTVGMLVIAVYYIAEALVLLQGGADESALFQLALGVFGVGVASYMFLRFRRRVTLIRQALPPTVLTVIECPTCGLKSLRNFMRGDFVFKAVEDCRKCSAAMVITGIYAEPEKK